MADYKPFINIGIVEYIKEELEERNWSQKDFADVLGCSEKFISDLINNKKEVSAEIASLLSNAFGQSPQYWLNLDFNCRLREKENAQNIY